MEAGYSKNGTKKEFVLEENERLIGFSSKLVKTTEARHTDPVFIIGRLEWLNLINLLF